MARDDKERAEMQACFTRLADRMREARSLRSGEIVMRLSGPSGGNFSLRCTGNDVDVSESVAAGTESRPLIELIGDGETVRFMLDGERDAREQFLAGSFRLRGDLRYASDLALEMGLIDQPL